MSNIVDIHAIKATRDTQAERAAAIIAAFDAFWPAFLERIDSFVAEAAALGFDDVHPVSNRSANGTIEAAFTIAGFDMILAASREVNIAPEADDDPIFAPGKPAAKLFLYHAGNQSSPAIEIVVHAIDTKRQGVYMRWLEKTSPEYINGNYVIETPADTAASVADHIVRHFYQLQTYWKQAPSLEAVRKHEHSYQELGFRGKENLTNP